MEEFTTITKILRDELMEKYKHLQNNLEIENEEETHDIDLFYDAIDEYYENNLETLEEYYNTDFNEDDDLDDYDKVLLELIRYIKNNKYKNLLYLIIFNDVYEHLKTNQICNNIQNNYEVKILEFLETFNIKELINKANTSNPFFMDIIEEFTDYQILCTEEEKDKNKKIIELTNNTKYINKFKIHILDDIQKQYTKTRKIY